MTNAERQNAWAARVAEFRASGQRVPAWCIAHQLKPHQLRYWLRKHEETQTRAMIPSPWLSLDLRDLQPNVPSLTIRVGQALVEVKPGFDPALLLDVVKTLSTRC